LDISNFVNNRSKIEKELSATGYEIYLGPEMASIYVVGDHTKIKEDVSQILRKYDVKFKSGIAAFNIEIK
jgi:hypothetical protein